MPTTVLLVEDNEVNRYLARFVLERAGYRVLVAEDGEQALQRVHEAPPALVLMDLRMPVLDGYEATRRLKADPATAAIPVIAVSAQVMPAERERALALGCVAYVDKPIDPEALVALVRHWAGGP